MLVTTRRRSARFQGRLLDVLPVPNLRPAFVLALLLSGSAWALAGSARGQAVSLDRLAPAPPPPVEATLPAEADVRVPPLPPALRPPPPWTLDLIGKLSATQVAYSNWTEGGLNTLALTATLDGQAVRKTRRWKQTHAADLALGFIQRDTLTVRKADDRLRLSSALQYQGNGFFHTFSPTLAASLRTQFLDGLNYDKNPFGDGRDPPVQVSGFLSPATLTQSVGLTYEPEPWIDQRLSLGAKQVLVAHEDLGVLYGLAPRENVRYEAGLESTTELDREVFDDMLVQSSLRLFASFNRESPDMVWENVVSLKFNEWISFDFELTTLYDSDVITALQVRETISLGASVKMI